MAAGKSAKRVTLRAKVERRQEAAHASSERAPLSNALSSSPSTAYVGGTTLASSAVPSPTEAERQVALHIREAVRQRHGRARRAPAAAKTGEAVGSRVTALGKVGSKRRLGKATKKEAASLQHPVAALRRASVVKRRRVTLPHKTAAEKRMTVAQEELLHFQRVQTVTAFVADPFNAVMEHITSTLDVLQPQTPDVGPAERSTSATRRR